MNLTEKWLEKLNTPGTEAHLTKLYGAANLQAQKERYAALLRTFEETFEGTDGVRLFSAPGD